MIKTYASPALEITLTLITSTTLVIWWTNNHFFLHLGKFRYLVLIIFLINKLAYLLYFFRLKELVIWALARHCLIRIVAASILLYQRLF